MKYKTAIVGVTLGSLFAAQPILAQTPEIITNELVNLCVKFPLNSRCDVLEALMPLEERSGEEAGCNFVFDPQGTDGGSCKINVGKQKITIYQELGEELDALDGERTTVEINVSRDRIFATNFQIWNKIRRWEVGFLPEDNDSQHPSNFLVMLMGENSAESLMSEIDDSAESKPKLLTEVLAAGDYQTPEIERLLETKACEYCDLSNADLSGVDLKGANLLGANLQEADLTDANFEGVNLVFGNLARATLVGTDFKGANLQEANLELADLQEAELSAPSYLKGANLREANLTDANLRGANLQEANLTDANLEGATWRFAPLKLASVKLASRRFAPFK
ncbi:MAG: pentapeptide repeat-containing protein [Cyanobacteria bacterium J06631_2]